MTWNVVRTLTTQNGVGDMACTRGGFTRGVEGAPGGDLPSASRTPGRLLRRHMEVVAACPPPRAQAAPAPPRMQAARPASAGGVSSDLAAASTAVCRSTPARRGSVRNTGRARSGLVEGFPKAVLSSHKNGVVSEA